MVIVYDKKSILEGVNFFSFFSLGQTQEQQPELSVSAVAAGKAWDGAASQFPPGRPTANSSHQPPPYLNLITQDIQSACNTEEWFEIFQWSTLTPATLCAQKVGDANS